MAGFSHNTGFLERARLGPGRNMLLHGSFKQGYIGGPRLRQKCLGRGGRKGQAVPRSLLV